MWPSVSSPRPRCRACIPIIAWAKARLGSSSTRAGFGHCAFRAIGQAHDKAKDDVSLGVIGGERKRLRGVPLGRSQTRRAVSALKFDTPKARIHERRPYERVDILGIDPQRLGKEGLGARKSGRILAFVEAGLAAKEEVHRVPGAPGAPPDAPPPTRGPRSVVRRAKPRFRPGLRRDPRPACRNARPTHRAGLGVHELRIIDPFAASKDASLEHVVDAEFATDLFEVDRLALVGEGGVPGDNEGAPNPGETGGEVFRHAVDKGFVIRVAAEVRELEHDHREAGRLAIRGLPPARAQDHYWRRWRRRLTRDRLPDRADEPKSFAGRRPDEPLLLPLSRLRSGPH